MIRATTRYYIDKAIEDELHSLVRDEPLYHSDKEAYAELLAVVDYITESWNCVGNDMEHLWYSVREGEDEEIQNNKKSLLQDVKIMVAEAVQIAAVIEKFSVRKGEDE